MKTKLSAKGQITLPSPMLRRLGLEAGDPLDAKVESGRIVLTPQKKGSKKARIVIDPVSGFPAVTLGRGAPVLTSKEVEDILSDFP